MIGRERQTGRGQGASGAGARRRRAARGRPAWWWRAVAAGAPIGRRLRPTAVTGGRVHRSWRVPRRHHRDHHTSAASVPPLPPAPPSRRRLVGRRRCGAATAALGRGARRGQPETAPEENGDRCPAPLGGRGVLDRSAGFVHRRRGRNRAVDPISSSLGPEHEPTAAAADERLHPIPAARSTRVCTRLVAIGEGHPFSRHSPGSCSCPGVVR